MRNLHVWKSTGEDGRKREVRAHKFAKEWKFQAKAKGDENWTYLDTPPMDDLHALRDVVWRKYQRKRLAWDDVESIDAMIIARGGTPGGEENAAAGEDEEDS